MDEQRQTKLQLYHPAALICKQKKVSESVALWSARRGRGLGDAAQHTTRPAKRRWKGNAHFMPPGGILTFSTLKNCELLLYSCGYFILWRPAHRTQHDKKALERSPSAFP
jgi:hypothetical protein